MEKRMSEMLEISKGFQTSINIAYDLKNDDKVKSFIPTQSSLDVIEDVLLSTYPNATGRARILIGAYGRGKSHIILVLMSLLFKKDKGLFNLLLKKMKVNNPPLHDYAIEYLNSKQRILPIIVRGSSTSLTQSFLAALQQALSEEGLSDLMPETHFKAAVNQITNWEANYPKTYKKFTGAISKSASDFILALNEYDVDAYTEFAHLYPDLTSGSVFNPFIGFDIVDLYEIIATKLKDKGFNGVYVIYDEFSKYLESSISTATNSDIKLLQDFAEKCDRSGKLQMHLMLISHKDISNYIDSNLPKDKVDGWRGVSGRFKHMNLHNNYSQMYEIISTVIQKNKKLWVKFKKDNQVRFDDLKDRFTKSGLINKNDQIEVDNAVEGCYPLHPISTFILPRLSEKVAQNERTLFTFLSSEDKHTLPAFLAGINDGFYLLTPDYIYDYFEPLFRKEPYTSAVHQTYKLTTSVLRKVKDNTLHAKIIKTISLIYLVEQFEKLPPIVDVVVDAFRDSVSDPKEINVVLNELIDKECVVYLKRSNSYLKIKETSGENIPEEIDKYIERKLLNTNVTDILNNSNFDSFMYPTAYNDNNDIIRYFDFTFIESEEYWNTTDWNTKISSARADGVIFAIVPIRQNEIVKLRKDIIKNTGQYNRIVFVLPKTYKDIRKDALDYAAAASLKEYAIKTNDEVLKDEYDLYVDDLSEVIGSFINSYTRPENSNAYYIYQGEQYNLKRKAQLSGLLTNICNTIFYRTPIINNESVNKNELPTVAINSRTKILAGLLGNELAPHLGLSATGQDVSIMRSTLLYTGVIENIDTVPAVQLVPNVNANSERMADMLAEINTFFLKHATDEGGAEFQTLYWALTSHENGFGLKKGVIPLYLAAVMHIYKKNLVISYRGSEVKITPELLNDINEQPSNYSVVLEDWNDEKTQYMEQLEGIFSEFLTERERAYNRFTYIVFAMNRWYLSLPKYTKEAVTYYDKNGKAKKIDTSKKQFINSLKQVDVNPRQFLFEKVFSIYGMSGFNLNAVDNITQTKAFYDNALPCLLKALKIKVRDIFGHGKTSSSLTSIMKDWYESLNKATKQYLFSGNESRILELIKNITNDEESFIQRLAKAVTYLRVDDWNSETVNTFQRDLMTFKQTIEDFNNRKEKKSDKSTSYEIIINGANSNAITKRFDKTTYSDKAILLRNVITNALDEMGQAITEQEKRQVLMELLVKLC
jgi:hypothetical protein